MVMDGLLHAKNKMVTFEMNPEPRETALAATNLCDLALLSELRKQKGGKGTYHSGFLRMFVCVLS